MASTSNSLQLNSYLPYLVNRAGQQFVGAISGVLAEAGIDVQMWRVLVVLFDHGSQPVSELAELTSINLSTLSRLIGRMESKGLVSREKKAGDARTVVIELTDAGQALTDTILPEAVALEAQATRRFTEAETQTLKNLLVKLFDGFAADDDTAETDTIDRRLAG